MKRNFKRTLSLVLAVLMVMTAVPLSGMATDACEHDYSVPVYVASEEAHYFKCSKCSDKDFSTMVGCDGGADVKCGEKKKCAICNGEYGPAAEHNFQEIDGEEFYVAGTGDCLHPKKYYKSCANDGCTVVDTNNTFDGANGECIPDEGVSNNDAACGVDGTLTITCTVCGEVISDDTVDVGSGLEHDFTKKAESDDRKVEGSVATCKKGYEYYFTCSREGCDEWTTTKTFFGKVNEKAHVLTEGVKKPAAADESEYLIMRADCMNDAMYSMVCNACGKAVATKLSEAKTEGLHFYYKADTALNPYHNKFDDPKLMKKLTDGKDGTCTTAAEPATYQCIIGSINCGEDDVYEKYPEKSKFEKDANGNYKYDKDGKIISIPLDHDIDASKTKVYKEAKCAVDGHYASEYCKACKYTFYYDKDGKADGKALGDITKTIKATGHKNNDGNDYCDLCGGLVKPADTCSCFCHKKDGIMYFVALILKWFWRLTNTNQYCKCSNAEFETRHY